MKDRYTQGQWAPWGSNPQPADYTYAQVSEHDERRDAVVLTFPAREQRLEDQAG
ncbi:hypothetical protein [Cellulomonas uda]|uniref:Uncharacterized protein n=1 Tax=Cellulomonas uda TaxID=1714 RepID=A0A4Y3KAC7_CELUD|nr:hypothetical protein [Cellulomonas uda]NII67835.1 hypothetical protein [Cellulomonas uda]GEA79918.1 hypothetical protein CUD01_03620 [Cellulomonas uda]